MEFGFLGKPIDGKLEHLPAEWKLWDGALEKLPEWLADGSARDRLRDLPELPTEALPDAHLPRAMLALSFLSHGFVWAQSPPAGTLPRNLAVPWKAVADRLGRPPVLSHASAVMDNWVLKDPSRPIEAENIETLASFTAGEDERWFYAVTAEVEAKAIPAVSAIVEAFKLINPSSEEKVSEPADCIARKLRKLLETSLESQKQMHAALKKMYAKCKPDVFYNKLRPFLSGWKGNSTLAEGLVYEGAYEGKPQYFYGGSGAQSSVIQLLDIAFNVNHVKAGTYLIEIRDYMPPEHRDLLVSLEKQRSIAKYLEEIEFSSEFELVDLLKANLKALQDFRNLHLNIVALYIVSQNPMKGKEADKGTGGTSVIPFLKEVRNDVKEAMEDLPTEKKRKR